MEAEIDSELGASFFAPGSRRRLGQLVNRARIMSQPPVRPAVMAVCASRSRLLGRTRREVTRARPCEVTSCNNGATLGALMKSWATQATPYHPARCVIADRCDVGEQCLATQHVTSVLLALISLCRASLRPTSRASTFSCAPFASQLTSGALCVRPEAGVGRGLRPQGGR